MAQYLKDAVRDRIERAALEVFARKGFRAATVAEIARHAGVSTGNVYRYFPDKTSLFYSVEPQAFVDEFLALLRRRVRALEGVRNLDTLPAGSAFAAVADDLLHFAVANRLRVVLLLGRAEGTRYEPVAGRLVAELQRLAVTHYRGLGLPVALTPALRFVLDRIYLAWQATLVETLSRCTEEAKIRERVEAFSRYHLAGLNALFLTPS